MPAKHHRWSDLPADNPMPLISRRRIIGAQAMISQVHLARGFKLASHHHPNEQFAIVLSGRVRFGLGQEGTPDHRTVTAAGGDVIELPGHVPHSAEALEDSVILDVFSPPSEKTGIDQVPRR